MKVCPSCGSELSDDLSFCPADGSPLLSEEETDEEGEVGEKTFVMTDESDVGEKTVVMPEGSDATVTIDHDELDEEETVVPDRPGDTAESVGDATLVMPEAALPGGIADAPSSEPDFPAEDVPSTPDDTMYASGEDEEVSDDTTDWSSPTGAVTDEWTGEPAAPDEDFGATAASAGDWEEVSADDEYEDLAEVDEEPDAAVVAADQAGDGEKKKSYLGLIIGLILLFGAFVVILAAGGFAWWYFSSQGPESAAVNTDQNANEDLSTPEEEIPFEDTNVNVDDNLDTDVNASPSPTTSPSNTNERATPSPRATRSPGPSPSQTVEITRPTPPGRTPTPPPARTPTPDRSTPTPPIPSRISRGVVNGQAISLPQPAYPAAARAANARGRVTVAVVIDRTGRVVSANAVNGHPLLRSAAESAARRARFRPTLLSGQPVEVSGAIVYNFQ